ncbi:MAG: hypothetical protein ACAH11_01930 [Sphingomonas sp.]
MKRMLSTAMIASAVLLAGCATTPRPGPIDVTRFHLGMPIAGDSIAVQPLTGFAGVSPEDQLYIGAVSGELGRLGFTPGGGEASPYIAAVSYKHENLGSVRTPPAVTIGVGGGSYSGRRGGGVGVGGGVGIPVGSKTVQVVATELTVQIKRRSDGTILWEGRAVTEEAGAQPMATANRLAKALFKGFPGESGITITVK